MALFGCSQDHPTALPAEPQQPEQPQPTREPDTAIEELRRRAARDGVSLADMHPRSIFPLELFLQSVVDLTTPERLEAWGLTPNDLVDASMKRCREVAAVAGQLGAEAIRWPSATGAGQSFAIFVDQLRRGSRVRIANSFEIMRPMLDALARGASITALLPEIAELPLIP